MRCRRCGNEDKEYFYLDKDTWYCRKCVLFGRLDVGQGVIKKEYKKVTHNCKYKLDYALTRNQSSVVESLNRLLQQKKDVLVYAACGAGKTEIVMQSIETYLNRGKKVGIAISRRQVVLEICTRMQEAFKEIEVIAVCEGYTDRVDADLIVCTMHQLYRYYQTFDLLIMDEIDAFPFAGNKMLETIAKDSCVGEVIYLSATPSKEMLQDVKEGKLDMLELFVRPHGYPLVVPMLKKRVSKLIYVQLILEIYKQKQKGKRILLFVPTIKGAKQIGILLKPLISNVVFTSQTQDKETIISKFRNSNYQCLVCTTVLERGITIDGVNVIVFMSDHMVFSEASLIQMVGRVGRKMNNPTGDALLIFNKTTSAIKRCVEGIKKMNLDVPSGKV